VRVLLVERVDIFTLGDEMRIHCIECGKVISNELPEDTIIRAVSICPECIEKQDEKQVIQHEHEIDELLCSFDPNETDEWEGGLLCTPNNRITVMNWLDKYFRPVSRDSE
jgi:hypothetical protein